MKSIISFKMDKGIVGYLIIYWTIFLMWKHIEQDFWEKSEKMKNVIWKKVTVLNVLLEKSEKLENVLKKRYSPSLNKLKNRKMSSKSLTVLLKEKVRNWKISSNSDTILLRLKAIRVWEEEDEMNLE